MNGSNDLDNLVDLTAKEHFICHHLLTKIYPNNVSSCYLTKLVKESKTNIIMNGKYKGWGIEYF